jgi:hypothetical protein
MRPGLIRSGVGFALLVAMLTVSDFAADSKTAYHPGTLLSIDKNVVQTPLSYVFDVVASYYETVTYRMQVRVDKEIYTVEYAPPVQPDGPVPAEWVVSAPVQVRVEKRKLIFKLASGREIESRIIGTKKSAA